MGYYVYSELKLLAKIWFSVICAHMVDFCRPSHSCQIVCIMIKTLWCHCIDVVSIITVKKHDFHDCDEL